MECKYCKNGYKASEPLVKHNPKSTLTGLDVYLDGSGMLTIMTFNGSSWQSTTHIEIEHCPKCGRKLGYDWPCE